MVSNLVTLSQANLRANNWGIATGSPITVDLTDSVTNIKILAKNDLTTVPYPISTSNALTKAPWTIIIPLKRITITFQITGNLSDTPNGDSAIVKMKKLMAMHEGGGTCTFVWRGMTFSTTSIQPVEITNFEVTDDWETIAGTDSDRIDSDDPRSAQYAKLEYLLEMTMGRERGT